MIIPTGKSKEDIKARERIIDKIYRNWIIENPTKKVFNSHLQDYINIRFISIDETKHHAAKSYNSTLAVIQLDTILRSAKILKKVKPKNKTKNQAHFSKMIIMECGLIGIGKIKLTVGIKKTNKEKIQYCITAIKT